MMQDGAAGYQEVFAEAFSRIHGGRTAQIVDVLIAFPKSAATVKAMIDEIGAGK